jgi:hypothetical protein
VFFLASKKGDKYKCEDCGLVIYIEEPCGCEPVEIACCSEPMKPVAAKGAAESKPKPKPKSSK